jgi:hypothetical protein
MSNRLFNLIRLLVLIIFLCPIFASVTQAREPIDPPWPWEKELPFPWDNIEGIWGGIHDDAAMIFSFEIIDNDSGDRQIKVKEINPETMEIIASGLGVENNNVLRAVMVGRKHRFRMSVRLIENEYCLDNKQYTMITIESMGRESYIFQFSVEKLANSPLTPPTNFNYKLHNFSASTLKKSMCFF